VGKVAEPTLAASSRTAGGDFIVARGGLATSALTALILWWIEAKSGFALYTWMVWFVIPVGAILAGFAGASGYYAGSWWFGRRPTRLLLQNVVLASIATFLLINYFSYVTLQIDGKPASDYVSFWKYLDLAVRSTSMELRYRGAVKLGSTGELGSFGYVIAFLQVIGFAIGGFAVYAVLASKPYCDKCSRYVSGKGQQIRYTQDGDGLQATRARVVESIQNRAVNSAIEIHRGFGNSEIQKDDHLRSTCEVRFCKKCNQHWVKFAVEKRTGNDWKELHDFTIAGFTQEIVSV
jgi:hypothetical protein